MSPDAIVPVSPLRERRHRAATEGARPLDPASEDDPPAGRPRGPCTDVSGDCAVYEDGHRKPGRVPLEQAGDVAGETSGSVWIGLEQPTAEDIRCGRRGVSAPATGGRGRRQARHLRGPNFVVTVRREELDSGKSSAVSVRALELRHPDQAQQDFSHAATAPVPSYSVPVPEHHGGQSQAPDGQKLSAGTHPPGLDMRYQTRREVWADPCAASLHRGSCGQRRNGPSAETHSLLGSERLQSCW
jgi:hypothetical protein